MNRVGDNNNFWYTYKIGSLVYTISNNKEFSFYTIDIDSIIKGFDHRFVINMNMRYGCHYIVLDTHICDN